MVKTLYIMYCHSQAISFVKWECMFPSRGLPLATRRSLHLFVLKCCLVRFLKNKKKSLSGASRWQKKPLLPLT